MNKNYGIIGIFNRDILGLYLILDTPPKPCMVDVGMKSHIWDHRMRFLFMNLDWE